MINNKAVERAYLQYKQDESLEVRQKIANRRFSWYMLALAVTFLLHVALPLPWSSWVNAWL